MRARGFLRGQQVFDLEIDDAALPTDAARDNRISVADEFVVVLYEEHAPADAPPPLMAIARLEQLR